MNNFNFYSPTYFSFGKEREDKVADFIKRFGGNRVLIHYGKNTIIDNGLLEKIKNNLDQAGIFHTSLGGVQANPRSALVYEGIALCKSQNIDFILAIGGGSVIDSAKAIAVGVPYEGDFWDFFQGKRIEDALPVGTILTMTAAGSEGSGDAVITHENGLLKRGMSGDAIRPVFSILNPEFTYSLSSYQTACGAIDIMAHVFERYFTYTQGVDITDRLCESILQTIIKYVPQALKNPTDYVARANIMWAGMIAHNNICGVGREQDWASHMIEHELSALYDVAHGAGLAVVFPAWMRYVMQHDLTYFVQVAERVWGIKKETTDLEKTALEGIEKFESFIKEIGMPLKFKEIKGAKKEDIPLLIDKINFTAEGTIGSFVKLNKADVAEIYEKML